MILMTANLRLLFMSQSLNTDQGNTDVSAWDYLSQIGWDRLNPSVQIRSVPTELLQVYRQLRFQVSIPQHRIRAVPTGLLESLGRRSPLRASQSLITDQGSSDGEEYANYTFERWAQESQSLSTDQGSSDQDIALRGSLRLLLCLNPSVQIRAVPTVTPLAKRAVHFT